MDFKPEFIFIYIGNLIALILLILFSEWILK